MIEGGLLPGRMGGGVAVFAGHGKAGGLMLGISGVRIIAQVASGTFPGCPAKNAGSMAVGTRGRSMPPFGYI